MNRDAEHNKVIHAIFKLRGPNFAKIGFILQSAVLATSDYPTSLEFL